jgi:type VI secretion system secreted protein Hcp
MPSPRVSVVVAVLLTVVGASTSLPAAIDMFLDLSPGIPGESTDKVHKDQVDVLAWSWGMSNAGAPVGGGGVGKANFQDLSVSKYVDKASPRLMSHCASGDLISKATLYLRKAGDTPIEFIKIQLTNVLVTSISTGGSGGEDRLTENVSLNFAKVQVDYVATKPDGSPETAILFRWDIPGNTGTLISPVVGLTSTLIYDNGAPMARLTWSSTAGASYQVWAASDLDAAFQRFGGPTASAGDGTTTVTVPADAIRKFFRIETLSTP